MHNQVPEISHLLGKSNRMGFFSWAIAVDLIFADSIFGDIYEIPPAVRARGFPIGLILERIDDDHRAFMAERIRQTLLGDEPSILQFQIVCPSGKTKSLTSIGSYAFDAEGVPNVCTGVVIHAGEQANEVANSSLEAHIKHSLALAKDANLELAERYLESALRTIPTRQAKT